MENASTLLEVLRLETRIESYETNNKRLTTKAFEKANRLEESHPRYKALSNNAAPHRNKRRSSWRQEAEKMDRSLPLVDLKKEPLPDGVQPPWSSSTCFELQWSTILQINELKQ